MPQNEYEAAAPLEITPRPDVITRVFLLFRGVDGNELKEWNPARVRASQTTDAWRDVVGMDLGKALDKSLFRVLEWGRHGGEISGASSGECDCNVMEVEAVDEVSPISLYVRF